jgi:hypothetical protein
MGEQRNLTENNVEFLKEKLEKMKETNPDLEYRFWEQDKEQGETEDTISIVKEIREKLEALDRKVSLIFDGHVLINGEFKKMPHQDSPGNMVGGSTTTKDSK